jgi:hypothetical protein
MYHQRQQVLPLARGISAFLTVTGTIFAILSFPIFFHSANGFPLTTKVIATMLGAYLIVMGPGWLVFIGLVRSALGKHNWLDPYGLWVACASVNALWCLLFIPAALDQIPRGNPFDRPLMDSPLDLIAILAPPYALVAVILSLAVMVAEHRRRQREWPERSDRSHGENGA